jgi:hypothetical protein
MFLPFKTILAVAAFITGIITSYSVLAQETVFDRLDGKGPSGKRVDVIEWEGNLEIHVYPKGSLQGLSAKLDEREKGKKVMVIGYRFDPNKKAHPLVRRAILGVPFHAGIKAFVDKSEKEYDKLALSNNGLAAPWAPYQLDPSPAQWYPDGHPSNEDSSSQPFLGSKSIQEKQITPPGVEGGTVQGSQRAPASLIQDSDFGDSSLEETDKKAEDREGRIKSFSW